MPSISIPKTADTYGHDPRKSSPYLERRLIETPTCAHFTFLNVNRLDECLSRPSTHPLALISFGKSAPSSLGSIACPVLSLDLVPLTAPPLMEVWTSPQPVNIIQNHPFHAGMNGVIAAAFISVEESPDVGLETTTYRAYHRLLTELRALGYPYVWRLWNYFPRINEQVDGLERYQRFCLGRHEALLETLMDFPASLPAGTAVGTAAGPLHVYALAGIRPAQHLGNPRQVNAYDYPKIYGPRSPSFSRATIARVDESAQLFLAGTASVVGHASQHISSVQAQTRETIENVRTLLHHAQDSTATDSFVDQQASTYKVYLRHGCDLGTVREAIEGTTLSQAQLLFLQGDLCREELLVEIEGVITSTAGPGPVC